MTRIFIAFYGTGQTTRFTGNSGKMANKQVTSHNYKNGFFKTLPASSSGTRLHRGFVEEASPEDRPPQTTHIVFVVHGIGQKMDQGRIIKNTGM